MVDKKVNFYNIYNKFVAYALQSPALCGINLNGKVILDIGCWWGWFIKYARGENAIVYGFDADKRRIDDAIVFNGPKGLCVGDATKIPFKSSHFDFVFLWHVLEHINNPDKVLSEINRVLKKRGTLILGVPNDYNLATLPYRWVRCLLNRENIHLGIKYYNFFKSLCYGDINHKREYTKRSICKELEKNGFEVSYIGIRGVDLPFPVRNIVNKRLRFYIQHRLDWLIVPLLRSAITVRAYKK